MLVRVKLVFPSVGAVRRGQRIRRAIRDGTNVTLVAQLTFCDHDTSPNSNWKVSRVRGGDVEYAMLSVLERAEVFGDTEREACSASGTREYGWANQKRTAEVGVLIVIGIANAQRDG